MKYWKEKEINLVEKMDFWKGDYITKLEPNEVFVFGANPQARHFAGAAKAALGFGAVPINVKQNKPGIARGLSPNNKTYALITKSLEAGYTEPETGITYHKEGFQSVSPEQIRANVDELYETAKKPEHLDKKFLVTYQYEAWPNGTPKKSLNGYTSQEMLEMFVKDKDVPPNIIFHESYKPHLEKLYKKQNKQSTGELLVYEDGKTIDIKEEDIIWTIDSDERNHQGINVAGAAKAAMSLSKGAKHCIGRGFNGSNAYALVTKSLNAGLLEKATGIVYDKEGYRSVSLEQIRANINELYEIARSPEHKNKKFLISYQYETWPNGTPKKSLNGYTSQEMLELFIKDQDIPPNIVFHESYRPHLKLIYNKDTSTHKNFYFFNLCSPFSNFHPAIFSYKELTFISNEQFMMYCKARIFKDEETANKILSFNKSVPIAIDFLNGKITVKDIIQNASKQNEWKLLMMKIKGLGRKVKNFNEDCWESRRYKTVLFGARLKFTQNENLKEVLLNTEGNFIECNKYDCVWSCGLTPYEAQKIPQEKWPGKNLLGHLLDDLKDEIKNELNEKQKFKSVSIK